MKIGSIVLVFTSVAGFFPGGARAQALEIPRKLSIGEAETLLLQRSLAIAANRHQLEVSQALRLISGYKPNPVLQLGAEQLAIQSPVPGGAPRFFSTNPDAGANSVYTAQLNKIFERGGKRELRVQQADALVDAARAQILDTFRTQLFQLRQAFANAILARENLRLAQSIDSQYGRTEQLTAIKVEAGDFAGVELYRVRAGRLQYRQAVLDAQTAYEQATRDVLNLLNLRPENIAPSPAESALVSKSASAQSGSLPSSLRSAPIEIVGTFSNRDVLPTLAEFRNVALSERPDVQVARANLRAAQRATLLAQAQRSRDISVAFEYQRVGDDHSVGIVTQIPLFLYNNQQAAIAQAVAQQRVAEAQLRQSERQVLTDVEKAYQSLLAAKRSIALYSSDNLVQVERLRSIAEFSFRSGGTSLFELLDAQRIASQAAVAYNQARASYQTSLWQLEQAIGRPLE